MNSETIKGRLNQHVKRRLQSQESIESKFSAQQSQPYTLTLVNQPTIKEEATENTCVKSAKKRKITKKSSIDQNPDDDDKCEKRIEKQDTGFNILTLILNHKKAELLRNPQIIELLDEKIEKNIIP